VLSVAYFILAVFLMVFGIWFLIVVLFKNFLRGTAAAAKEEETNNQAQSSNVSLP
jgi:hypothetical protein